MAGEPTGRKRGPKGSTIEKYRRDLDIYREWLEGRSAAALAREHDLSDRQVRAVVKDMREVAADPPRDRSPQRIADEMIVRMEEGMRELALAANDLDGAARVRAIGVRLRALNSYYRLLEKAGRVPSEPRQWRTERDIARVAEVVLDVFDRYGVPVEARREIRDLLRS